MEFRKIQKLEKKRLQTEIKPSFMNYFAAPHKFHVLVGEHDTMSHLDRAVKHEVACQSPYPAYSLSGFNNDYAVLTLKEPIDLSESSPARAACLPDPQDMSNFVAKRTEIVISGWGRPTAKDAFNTRLHHVTVPYVSQSNCKRAFPSYITNNMFCAGDFARGGIDACYGDSGGKFLAF